MDRRTYLVTATGAVVALAGCSEMGGPGETDDENGDDGAANGDDDHEETETEEEDEEEEDADHGDLVGTYDDFEDLDPWDAFQDIGSIEADTEQYYEGSQSAHLLPDSEDGQVRVRRETDEPIDIRDVAPGVAMTASDSGMVLIQLQDENGDYVEYSQQVMDNMPLARHNFGLTRVRGDPNLEEIIVLQIIRWFGEPDDEDEDGDGEEMWVDDFHFVPKPDTPKVMLQFHGGYETHYEEAMPRVAQYDLPATTFVPPDRLRADAAVEGDRLTESQVEELAAEGWTIGCQTANGSQVDSIDEVGAEDVIVEPAEWLEDEGYADDGRFFAFPGSQYTEESYELVQENYDLAFAGQTQSQGYAGNPHLCSVVSNPSGDEGGDLVEWTAEMGGITSIGFYQLEESEAIEGLESTLEALEEYSGEIDVITPGEMADDYVY
ncbi:polysaccharide deacetylase family protein [Natronococcus occultus]|uniref:Putative xylanase/chitin deacetylase n=1 Tax=Natronococcus occultus SP4 TaxID=694430 RepID=L0K360_9EURY|nr:polysaccharide deacetylase family protein [Natronococcus occultus]AGB38990.1 putative xylanase/chitin deacetylase [Natronococcus occultus SP4]